LNQRLAFSDWLIKSLRLGWVTLLLALWGFAGAHVISFSHVDVRLEQGEARLTVQLPIKALLHEQPSPLPPGTTEQALRSSPLPAGVQTYLKTMLTARLRLTSSGQSLPLTVSGVRSAGEDVALTLTAPPVPGALGVQANLFPEDSLHKIFVNVYRKDALVGQYALDRQDASFTLAAPERPLWDAITTFVREGIHHIFIGPDHILFVLALILLGGTLWSQFKIITAFTVAHSITLALATLNIVHLPSQLVESVIALSIVVVGVHDVRQLRRSGTERTGWDVRIPFAFAFGLVHGFGFASVLTELDLPQKALAWSLAAFNVGVEIGQVTIVLLATPLLLAVRRYAAPQVSQGLLTAAASVVVLVGGFWLVQRAFNL
jgi:hydrogenase/urease accessory protein HupE